MTNRAHVLTVAVAAATVLLPTLARAAGPAEASACSTATLLADAPAACCYSNPSYSGVCQVKPAQDETCASILSYLNTALSTGKSYCSNTDIRGGWKQVACEKPTTSARSTPAQAESLQPR
jgi:hypothetical protein